MINKDFKRSRYSRPSRKSLFAPKKKSKAIPLLATFTVITAIAGYFYTSDSATSSQVIETLAIDQQLLVDGSLTLESSSQTSKQPTASSDTLGSNQVAQAILTPETLKQIPQATPAKTEWQTVAVKKNDTLAKIFQEQGYSASDLHYLMKSGENIAILKNIRPGHKIEFAKTTKPEILTTDNSATAKTVSNEFESLRYPYSLSETLIVSKIGNKQFASEIEQKEITFKQRFATATIESSFYNAGIAAGLPDGVIMELAGVFEYDIDFALEIRKNDTFSVLYQEKFIDGKKAGYGDILSAEFVNQGDQYAAVQYTDLNERTAYYTPDGKALRKSFLRAPLKFNYVSSNFNPRRFHPILKRTKAHRGVDYRAATGTPVRASGDGRVIRSKYDKNNGHHVFVQHGNNIVTKYLHFSKRKVKRGQRVKQGQIIGYVGSTGMSQAPHLHYEFVVNGVHRNPRTVKLPHASPVRKKELARFKEQTKPLLSQLEIERTQHFARLNLNPDNTKLKQ